MINYKNSFKSLLKWAGGKRWPFQVHFHSNSLTREKDLNRVAQNTEVIY